MTSTEAAQIPPGIYRIAVIGVGVDDATLPTLLTRHNETVTLLPPSVHPSSDQEWRVAYGRDGNVIIERPFGLRPSTYLTYKDAPKKPEEHDRVLERLSEFPPNEWHLTIAPGFRIYIRVAHSELGIRIGPQKIHPPFLELGHKDQLQWMFEFVHHASE